MSDQTVGAGDARPTAHDIQAKLTASFVEHFSTYAEGEFPEWAEEILWSLARAIASGESVTVHFGKEGGTVNILAFSPLPEM